MLVSVNYLAVIVSAVAAMAIGYLWYQPSLFGNMWMKYVGKSSMELGNPTTGYLLTFVSALIMAWVLAEVLAFTGASTVLGGLKIAGLLWLGFSATTALSNALFAGKKQGQYFLEQGNHLVVLLVMAVILVLWK